jgi:TRAP-type C4-dicarboxylate transport system permease small subunit
VKHGLIGLAHVLGLVARAALWVAGASLVLMTALVFWQVIARYVLNDPSTLTEPLSILLMGWFIFLGAAVGTREGYHLSFDVLLYALPPRLAWILHSTSDVAVAAFGFGMFWYGGTLMLGTWSTTLPSTGFPSGVALLPVVLGGVMIVMFSLERLARRAAGLHTARFGAVADTEEGA